MMDEQVLKLLRNLRALAENDGATPAERDLALQRLQAIKLKHAVDDFMLDQGHRLGQPVQKRFLYAHVGRHAEPKAVLLNNIARANHCRLVTYLENKKRKEQWSTLVGFPDDIEFVELLYTDLLLQMTREAALAVDVKFGSQSTGKFAYRRSFMTAFAERIYSRLMAAEQDVVKEGGTGTELALRSRADIVDEEFVKFFPYLGKAKKSRADINWEAYSQGQRAADKADVSGGRGKVSRNSRELED